MTCLSIIGVGWAIFTCEQKADMEPFSRAVSYSTNAPLDILRAIVQSCENDSDFEVEFDSEEGDYWVIEASNERVVAVVENPDSEVEDVRELRITKQQLIQQLLMDIFVDIKGWTSFLSVNATDDEIKEFDMNLKTLFDRAKAAYKERYAERDNYGI